jgi:translation initiation factor 6
MNIKTISLRGSPYVGLFCIATDEYALVPAFMEAKDVKKLEDTLNVKAIVTTIADTHLLGVLGKGLGKKIVVASTISKEEIQTLEKHGIHVHVMDDITAIGNLLCVQKNGGIISPLIPDAERKKIEKFLGIPLHVASVSKSELAGSCVLATEKGFLAHPKAEPEEMEMLESIFKVPGMRTTANYGDPFPGNSIIANTYGCVVGERTSGPELARIDEGLHPLPTTK